MNDLNKLNCSKCEEVLDNKKFKICLHYLCHKCYLEESRFINLCRLCMIEVNTLKKELTHSIQSVCLSNNEGVDENTLLYSNEDNQSHEKKDNSIKLQKNLNKIGSKRKYQNISNCNKPNISTNKLDGRVLTIEQQLDFLLMQFQDNYTHCTQIKEESDILINPNFCKKVKF